MASPAEGRVPAGTLTPPEAVFARVRSQTAFEETVDQLGTAIKLGLLPAGSRLPPERELCARLGIARSTLRQALTALSQSGHVFATRGRHGGTFVSDPQPPAHPPSPDTLARWHETCDRRLAVALALEDALEDFPAYRQADIRLHVGLAEATRSARLVREMTEVQGAMTDLISYIAHPPEILSSSNAQHRRLLAAVREGDSNRAAQEMTEHLKGTEHVLAGLLPGG